MARRGHLRRARRKQGAARQQFVQAAQEIEDGTSQSVSALYKREHSRSGGAGRHVDYEVTGELEEQIKREPCSGCGRPVGHTDAGTTTVHDPYDVGTKKGPPPPGECTLVFTCGECNLSALAARLKELALP